MNLKALDLAVAQTDADIILGTAFAAAVAEVHADVEGRDGGFEATGPSSRRAKLRAAMDGLAARQGPEASPYEILDNAGHCNAVRARAEELF